MREIKVDGFDLPASDPIRELIEIIMDIHERKDFVFPLAINFENGVPVKATLSKSIKFKRTNC